MSDSSDLRPLGLARAAFGTVFLLRTTPILAAFDPVFLRDMGPLLGWPDARWHAPVLGLTLPAGIVAALCVLRTAGAACLMLGIRSRLAGVVAGVAGYVVLAQDAFGYFHHLHLLFSGAILLGLADAGSTFALAPEPARAPRSSLLLIHLFVASIYLWAGIGKIRADWLDGRALAMFHSEGALRGAIAETFLATEGRRVAVAWAIALGELALGPALLYARTRRAAIVAAVLLHLGLEAAGRVDTIGWQMLALLTSFLPWGRTPPPPPATR